MQVLLADDDATTRFIVKRVMSKLGRFHVHEAADGVEAVGILEAHRVDAVVTDFRMPGKSGMDVLRRAREIQPHARRVLMSGTFAAAVLRTAADPVCVDLAFEKPMRAHEWERFLREGLGFRPLDECV